VLAGLAAERSIRFVQVSTDYVFSGDNPNGYEEADAPDPLQVYGQTKAEAERYCRDVPGTLVVRLPLLFGIGHGAPRATFPEQVARSLRAGEEITADAVEVRQPTYTADAAVVLRQLTEAGMAGVVHVAGQQPITKYDWAVAIAGMAGLDASLIRPGRPAPDSKRPVRSWLRVHRLAELGIAPPRPVSDTTPEFLRAASLTR
jgi:dTDP-4-dehydrorhamnose reductase